jgi:uncharacterized protein YdeI (YjbR/CyaY-like superfamily)
MKNLNPEVTKYIDNVQDFAKPILTHLRKLIHEACPDIEEKIKWGIPHFDYKGPVSSMAGFKAHATFGFWKASLLKDTNKVLENNEVAMGSFGRLTSVEDLPKDEILIKYIKEAVQLNLDGKKVTIRKFAPKELVIPDYLNKVLNSNKVAKENFDKMPPSHKKEYVEWVTGAKQEETRERRIEKMMGMLKENRSMNEKYK